MDVQYASNGKGNLGVTLGAIGTGLGLLDGGANILGKFLGGAGSASSPDDNPVTRYEAGLMQNALLLCTCNYTCNQNFLTISETF